MKLIEEVLRYLNNDITFRKLAKIIALLTVVLLFELTGTIWTTIFYKVWSITKPFMIGFSIAFVLQPLIQWSDSKKISKNISIPVIYILIALLFFWLVFTLVPMVFMRLSDFIPSLVSGINAFYEVLKHSTSSEVPDWIKGMVESATTVLNDYKGILPTLSANITKVVNNTLSFLTDGIFTIVISIYVSFSWDSICKRILEIAKYFRKDSDVYIYAISEDIGTYVRSLLILMLVKFTEYALLYFLVGHSNWLIIGLLTAVGLVIPYVGATLANIIGIITAFTLPLSKVILLVLMIGVLSNVDAYFISPFVYSRNIKISPLWGIFCVYAGGLLMGIGGIIVAIPVYISIRTIISIKQKQQRGVSE